jgi:hypothetical protein
MTESESLVMRYFHAWHSHDFEAMRRCLADDVRFDMGRAPSFSNADDFADFCRRSPGMRDVTLLEAIVTDDRAALLFEGVRDDSGARSRSAAFMRILHGKIRLVSVATTLLDDGPSAATTLRNPTYAERYFRDAHPH